MKPYKFTPLRLYNLEAMRGGWDGIQTITFISLYYSEPCEIPVSQYESTSKKKKRIKTDGNKYQQLNLIDATMGVSSLVKLGVRPSTTFEINALSQVKARKYREKQDRWTYRGEKKRLLYWTTWCFSKPDLFWKNHFWVHSFLLLTLTWVEKNLWKWVGRSSSLAYRATTFILVPNVFYF